MTFESGGQGLWSTVDDYLAFARIFLGQSSLSLYFGNKAMHGDMECFFKVRGIPKAASI